MNRLVTEEALQKIQECREKDAYYELLIQKGLFGIMPEMISYDNLVGVDEGLEFWYVTAKLQLAALAFKMGCKTPGLEKWVHDRVMELITMEDDRWIGPFFRKRTNPPEGQLETGNIMEALGVFYLTAPEILNEEETALFLKKVKEVGAYYCYNWLESRKKAGTFGDNNWTIQLLCGYAFAAFILDDEDMMNYVVEHYNLAAGKAMNSDFYGEPVGYWSYAAGEYSIVSLLVHAFRPDLYEKMLSAEEFGRILPWAMAQRIGYYTPEALHDQKIPRMVNFSDGEAMDRIRTMTITGIAYLLKDKNPELASLASLALREFYPEESIVLENAKKGVGEYNTPHFWLYLYYPCFPEPKDTAGLVKRSGAQRFSDGVTVYRNKGLFAAVNGGSTEPFKVIEHRHADQGTFVAAYRDIVLLDDPGKCCYRLPAYGRSKLDTSHSLPYFTKGEEALHQRPTGGADVLLPPKNKDLGHSLSEDSFAVTSDLTALYPDTFRKVIRKISGFGSHILLVQDEYEADEELNAGVRFVLNNRMMKMKWQIRGGEGKAAREGVGVRVISLEKITPTLGYGTVHDKGHVFPNGPTQGREGSAYEFLFAFAKNEKTKKAGFLLILDEEKKLDSWTFAFEGKMLCVTSPEEKRIITL